MDFLIGCHVESISMFNDTHACCENAFEQQWDVILIAVNADKVISKPKLF